VLTKGSAGVILLAAAGCALLAPSPDQPTRLEIRAPDLAHPLSEVYPAPSKPEDPVKLGVWQRINADRKKAGLPPVAWDEGAARVADAFCAKQVQEQTRGHFLLNGFPPYSRTGFAGVFGMDSENAVAWTTTGGSFQDPPLRLALSGQESMMAEKPPADGHRKTILDPEVTHVGVGWAQGSGRFRMAQEFLVRHLAKLTLEQTADNPATVLVKGQTLSDYRIAFVTLAHESTPRPLTRGQANARTHYEFPQPRLAYVPEGLKSMHVVGADTLDIVRVGPGNEFAFRFTPASTGLWTIIFYTSNAREKPRPGGAAVLQVEKAAAR
jgi:Cysteine-rich secretory protein family